ncbi:hypothetical protein B7P43_G04310 [Cryptotermes secundus]|uniref:Uncharacterized protein n=1 Tax=Cryptotermes secundus TaxID=105785 RepID=A0A2J7Q685_9NEOP|nr:hypothetical protein B7P43_G04310 [Cryptotermes secundus]
MEKFKYVGMTVTNQDLIHEEINSRLNLGNICYNSVQSLLSACLLLSSQEYGLKVIQNRTLRRIFGPTRDEMVKGLEKLHNKERR